MNRILVTRGNRIESEHRVHIVVADSGGRILAHGGDPDRPVFLRSVAKLFQTVPLIEDGIVDRCDMSVREIAISCGSHGGQPAHVEIVASFLNRLGLTEDQLECGAHLPLHEPSAHLLIRDGEKASRIHNNCSGKHTGMLAMSLDRGWDLDGYVKEGHPVQRRMLSEVARWTEVREGDIGRGVDGCGVVTFELPLSALASSFARFGAAAARGDGASAVVDAMVGNPFMVAGDGRLCTDVLVRAGDRVFLKTGAEGVYAAAARDGSFGVAVKVEDGGRRASDVALVNVLGAVGLIDDEDLVALRHHARPSITNTLGEVVGEIRAELHLPQIATAGGGR